VEQLCLDGLDRGTISWGNVITGPVVIVRVNVRVVIVRVVVVRVIGKIIPRKKTVIQSTPKPVDKDKEVTVIEMSMASIPIAVPICLMAFGYVVRSSVQS